MFSQNKRCSFLNILSGDNRTNNVDYYNEVLEQENGKVTHGKQMFCLYKVCITYDQKVNIY
jgi:hypothetical protein